MARTYVELVEDDESLRPEEDRRPGIVDVVRRNPVRSLVAAAAVLALVAAALVGQLVVDARERARLARLSDLPGVLRPVDLPLRTLVATEGDVAGAMQYGVPVGRTLVAGSYSPVLADPEVMAVDRSTGEVVWQVAVGLPPATEPAPDVETQNDASSNVWCSAVDEPAVDGSGDDAEHARVACTVSRSYGWRLREDGSGSEVAVRGLVVLDATDGAVVSRHDEELGAEIFTAGDGYWVTTLDDDQRGVTVVARTYDGDERWTTHIDVPGSVPPGITPFVAHDDRRTVLGVGTRAWVLGPDGSTVATIGSGSGDGGLSLVPGGVLIQSYGAVGGRPGAGVLWRDDGTQVDLGGDEPFWFSLDDGSRPDAFFTVSGGTGPLVRRDEDGDEMWHADVMVGSSAVLLDGTAVVAGGDQLAAVDVDTGDVRWRTTMPMPVDQFFTDGRVLLGVNGRTVRAYGADDGVLRWTARLVEHEDGTAVLDRTATDDPSAPGAGPTDGLDDGWWTVTSDDRLAYSDSTETARVFVLG